MHELSLASHVWTLIVAISFHPQSAQSEQVNQQWKSHQHMETSFDQLNISSLQFIEKKQTQNDIGINFTSEFYRHGRFTRNPQSTSIEEKTFVNTEGSSFGEKKPSKVAVKKKLKRTRKENDLDMTGSVKCDARRKGWKKIIRKLRRNNTHKSGDETISRRSKMTKLKRLKSSRETDMQGEESFRDLKEVYLSIIKLTKINILHKRFILRTQVTFVANFECSSSTARYSIQESVIKFCKLTLSTSNVVDESTSENHGLSLLFSQSRVFQSHQYLSLFASKHVSLSNRTSLRFPNQQDDLTQLSYLRNKRQLVPPIRTSPYPICTLLICNLFHWNIRKPASTTTENNNLVTPHQASHNFWRFFMSPYYVRWPLQPHWSDNQLLSPIRPIWSMFIPTFSPNHGNLQHVPNSGPGTQQGPHGHTSNEFSYGGGNGASSTVVGGGRPSTGLVSNRPNSDQTKRPEENFMNKPAQQTTTLDHTEKTTLTTTASDYSSMSTTQRTYQTSYAANVNTMKPKTNPPNGMAKPMTNSSTPKPIATNLTTLKPKSTNMKQGLETTTKKCNKTKTDGTKAQDNQPNSRTNITEDKNLTNMWLDGSVNKLKERWNQTVSSGVGSKGNGQASIAGISGGIQQDWWDDQSHSPGSGQAFNSFHGNVTGFYDNGLFVNNGNHGNTSRFYDNRFADLFSLPNQFNFTKEGMNFMVPLWWNMMQYEPGFGEGLFVSSSQRPQPEPRQNRGQVNHR